MVTEINYVAGIDFGDVSSEFSIAHVNDPLNIFTVNIWGQAKEKTIIPRRYHSSILYKQYEDDDIVCGTHSPYLGPNDIYIPSIKQYLFDIENANEQLGKLKEGLTIKKVVTDYLACFVKLALERLQIHETFSKSEYFQRDFNLDNVGNIRYCLACPKNLKRFMLDCFIDAGIIEDSESKERLSFVSEVEAIAYRQLFLDKKVTKMNTNQKYLVCNVGEISVGIAKVDVDTTASFSTVSLVYEDGKAGSTALEVRLRNYLEEHSIKLNLDPSIIDNLIKVFKEKFKFNYHKISCRVEFEILDSNNNYINIYCKDLNEKVIFPVIEDIIQSIVGASRAYEDCQIIIAGKYGTDQFFIENLKRKIGNKDLSLDLHMIEESYNTVSSGAVALDLRTSEFQIPFFVHNDKAQADLEKSDNQRDENEDYDFIVGIDFGAEYSGCSYINLMDTERKIKTIANDWPGGNSIIYGKTPTVMTFDDKKKFVYWGEKAKTMANNYTKKMTLLKNFKLFLLPEFKENVYDDLKENQLSSINVISSYIEHFKNHIFKYIIDNETKDKFSFYNKGKLYDKYKIRYVIAVPTYSQEQVVQEAIISTLVKKNETDRVFIISEPDAAAIFLKYQFDTYFQGPKSTNFIVCDAGAGTVDLKTFCLENNETTNEDDESISNPKLYQIGKSVCDTCGSNYLDVMLKNYILQFYEDVGVDTKSIKINFDNILNNFENTQKKIFMPSSNGENYFDIQLPITVNDIDADNTHYTLFDNNTTLRMSNKELQRKVFDPAVDCVLNLINRQKIQAEKEGKPINSILVVGGFSQSKYLQQCIKSKYSKISINVPYEIADTISHGAVYYGLNPRIISKGYAEQSISLEVQAPFEKNDVENLMHKIVNGPKDTAFAKNRLQYFVKKDQELHGGRHNIYTKTVYVEYPNDAIIAIFASNSEKDANERFLNNSHVKIIETRIVMPKNLTEIVKGKLIEFKIDLQIEPMSLNVTIECQDGLINEKIKMISNCEKNSLAVETKFNLNVMQSKNPSLTKLFDTKASQVLDLRVKSQPGCYTATSY